MSQCPPTPIYEMKEPTYENLNHLDVGSVLVMKNVYLRWNELIGSRWFVVNRFIGITNQTKITPAEKGIADINVYVLRPLYPRHAHVPDCNTAEWEISEGTLFEYFDIQEYKTDVQTGPMI
jgi:hypothetical protein